MAGGPDVTSVGVFGSDVSALLQTASKNAPSSATDAGTPGQLAFDGQHLYVCTAPNTWSFVALVPLPAMAKQAEPHQPEPQIETPSFVPSSHHLAARKEPEPAPAHGLHKRK